MLSQKFLTLLLCTETTISQSGNDTDRSALLRFKDSISGDPNGVLSSWNDSVHFCEWFGVTCSKRHRLRATALELPDLYLRGAIPPEFGNLSFLRALDLMNNSFSGEIPPELGRLSRLQSLALSYNLLGGQIPVNLSSCSRLEVVVIGTNNLTGEIPSELGYLAKLGLLNLEANSLAGKIPRSLGNASSLRELYLGRNDIAGNVPEELGRLRKLSVLAIGPNNLSGTIPNSIYNMSSLTSFSVTDNRFEGKILGLRFPNLIEFYVGGNGFSGVIPGSLSNSSRLLRVDLSDNDFTGQVPESFGKLGDVRWLLLNTNRLGNYSARSLDFVESLTNCSKLEVLVLSENNFGGVLPRSLANLSTRIERIYLGGNRISGNVPSALQSLGNLVVLSVELNLFTGDIPSSLGKLKHLEVLDLRANSFTGKVPESIGNLSKIFGLYLSHNNLVGNIPQNIANCHLLSDLDFSNNRLSGAVPVEFFRLYSSIFLDLSRNSLTGRLAMEVGSLKHLTKFDLSDNGLSGEIPGSVGGCESLEFLYLQGNSFQGSLPSGLASLRGLRYLDVSRNNLTGEIPEGLENLDLQFLNLSFNDLEGEVPKGGFFQNTSAVSLLGNTKLCGGVSKLQLQRCHIKESDHGRNNSRKIIIVAVCLAVVLVLFSGLIVLFFGRKSRRKSSSEEETINFLPKVSYKKLCDATNGFSPSTLIGTGGFGSVYKGVLDDGKNPVAIKVLNLQQSGADKSFVAECNALRNVKHRNLVKVLTCCSSMDYNGNEFKALVFEYMPNGSLDKWLSYTSTGERPSTGLSLIQRIDIAIDIASAILYLHEDCDQPIIHRDLKLSNVLLDNEMVARVSDFGLAKLVSNTVDGQTSTAGIKGTIGYAAPEYAMGGEPSRQGDVYSFGIILLEMFTGKRPTDEMFRDEFDLRSFVRTALQEGIEQIVDSALVACRVEETIEIEIGIEVGNEELKKKCLVSVLEIGLACSEVSPNERMSIGDTVRELEFIKQRIN